MYNNKLYFLRITNTNSFNLIREDHKIKVTNKNFLTI